MKKILLSAALFLSLGITAWAQAPQQFNYQGIARSTEGTPLASTIISLRLTIHEGAATGAVDYQETQQTTTNTFGIYTVFIGAGHVNTDGGGAATLGAVSWGTGGKYLQVEIDPTGATNYAQAGTAQLLSVPYALYSANSPATGVTQVTAGAGLNGGVITTTGTVSMPNEGVPGTYGSGTTVPVITTDAQGRVTAVTNTPITAGSGTVTTINTGAGLTGGPITSSGTISLGTAGTPGTYGSATQVPVFTTDIYGRVTGVTNTPIAAGAGTVTAVTAGAGLLGGTITSAGTVSMPAVVTAGIYGSATQVPVITLDAYGRVTNVTPTTISGGGGGSGTVAGTTNYIAKFTSATAVGNSGMYNTTAGDVGLGTTAPIAKFDVETTDSMAGNFVSTAAAAPQNGVLNGTYNGTDATNPSVGVIGTALPDITVSAGVGTVGVGGSLGVSAVAESLDPGGAPTAVQGQSFSDGDYGVAVAGFAKAFTIGALFNYGIYGATDTTGFINDFAGEFIGNLDCTGTFTAVAKAFKMDDPLDPANKYLYHSCVESNEMIDMYTGNVTTNASGVATVTLPDYFEALNKDFRYQLTVIGTFAQAIVSKEVSGNQFEIKTNVPNVKVSWQVTGVRHDAYANAHPIIAEVEKPNLIKGKYINPELFGKTKDFQIGRLEPKPFKGLKPITAATKNQNSRPTNPDTK